MTMKSTQRNPSVVVIGAGMTGILMSIKLQEAGITDVTILEKAAKLGGTWRENTYPGVACDVPAHMYTYSFAPNPEWSHRFAPGSEIQGYFEDVARRYGIQDKVRYNEAVTKCHYLNGQWELETSQGHSLTADFVISATGILHHPAYPDIPGLEDFSGDCFHTARWDHSVDLKGKRIGIIGTGSTAAQVIPELQKTAGQLTVFQRTPQWIAPQPNPEYSEEAKEEFRTNQRFLEKVRQRQFQAFEQIFSKAVIGKKIPHLVMSLTAKWNLRRNVRDPQLRARLTPDYKVGCKRLIFSSLFYPAIQQENVHLETSGIECIEPGGVRTKDANSTNWTFWCCPRAFIPSTSCGPWTCAARTGSLSTRPGARKYRPTARSACPSSPTFSSCWAPTRRLVTIQSLRWARCRAAMHYNSYRPGEIGK